MAAVQHADQELADLPPASPSEEADPAKDITACTRTLVRHLRDSERVDGCPIGVTALETTGRVPLLEDTAAQAFQHRQDVVTDNSA
ncbi:hypothetical protein ACFUGD_07980 [Streptomyces sp. NPDC057217]|uniref:LmrA/YxaF family transcription factor n=1 Tax=Streptomyces sp. NPDC057217 TaxID=3346054 RepID=UPI0036436D56